MVLTWDIQQPVITVCSFLGFSLVCIPVYWHLEAWNVGCVLYAFWAGIGCLIQGINMVVWRNNAISRVEAWCEIAWRFRIAYSVGIPAASLIINRRLYKIASISTVSLTHHDRRKMIYVDLAIGLTPSIVQLGIFWFIQGHRYDIYEGIGPMAEYANTTLSFFLYTTWPIVIGCISGVYCVLSLRAFLQRRKQFNELLSSHSNLNVTRYARLMGIAGIDLLCTVPAGIWSVVIQAGQPHYIWYGLANLHYDFSRIEQYPVILWWNDNVFRTDMLFTLWDIIVCAFLFFIFFGTGEETRKHYSMALSSLAKRVGISTSFMSRSGSNGSYGYGSSKPSGSALAKITIPSFVQRKQRANSINSFSDRLSTSICLDEDTPVDELKAVHYAPSSRSGGSSTCLPSPVSPKGMDDEKADAFIVHVPVAQPPAIHDVSTLVRVTSVSSAPAHKDSSDMV